MPKLFELHYLQRLLAIRLNSIDVIHRSRLLGRTSPNPSRSTNPAPNVGILVKESH
jgi:hypothetical protein